MAAGGDDDIVGRRIDEAVVFPLDDGGADGCLFNVVEAELLERFAHRADAGALVIGDKGGGQADDDRRIGLQQHLDLFGLIDDLLGVLRTDNKALTAHDALVANDVSLVAGKADGFDGAVPDALIAVPAV